MDTRIEVYPTAQAVAEAFAEQLATLARQSSAESAPSVHVCLSGGSTPQRMFEVLTNNHAGVTWTGVHFYWGDERCVAPDDPESNFGVAHRMFLGPAQVPLSNIHRVTGEIDPYQAAREYAAELKQHVPLDRQGYPRFDMLILGMGDDGHTASIFPHQMEFLDSESICEVATHPQSGQRRVTVTGPVIQAAQDVCFLITGSNKAKVLGQIVNHESEADQYPAQRFMLLDQTRLILDQAAAEDLPPNFRAR